MAETYDFVAIGGGNAGLTATAKVRGKGLKVALIDRGPIGGLCSLNGCNPKKVLVRGTEVLEEARQGDHHGVRADGVRLDWPALQARRRSFTDPVTANSMRALEKKDIEFIAGAPRFVSPSEVAIGDRRISAGGFLIATGSTPRPLEFPGAELVRASDDLLAVAIAPNRLAIIGAGVVGLELAHVFARAGSAVTILEPTPSALGPLDQELVSDLVSFSRKLGIEFHFGVKITAVESGKGGLRVHFAQGSGSQELAADFVLNAAGRVPALGDLDLGKGSIATTGRGIDVSDYLRSSSNPRVFAAGDAHGRLQLSPVASYEGGIAARNFLEGDVEKADYSSIPSVVFTIPQLASVGITEAAAKARNLDFRAATNDVSDWKVYAIAGARPARAKVLVEGKSGRILGAHLLGAGAGEVIHLYALAMRFGIRADELRQAAFAYPTLSSAVPYTL